MARPNKDFVNNDRVLGRLKPTAALRLFPPIKPDIDNLAKFVLDALNGVGYHDDSQIVKLEVHKMRDNEGSCDGGTLVVFGRHNNTPPVLPNGPRGFVN